MPKPYIRDVSSATGCLATFPIARSPTFSHKGANSIAGFAEYISRTTGMRFAARLATPNPGKLPILRHNVPRKTALGEITDDKPTYRY